MLTWNWWQDWWSELRRCRLRGCVVWMTSEDHQCQWQSPSEWSTAGNSDRGAEWKWWDRSSSQWRSTWSNDDCCLQQIHCINSMICYRHSSAATTAHHTLQSTAVISKQSLMMNIVTGHNRLYQPLIHAQHKKKQIIQTIIATPQT